ncbi:hypothetical protein [Cypionkella psychrotolerans]|uniref:hypothetical protein n=1 Tax=Cypionkella psychrotolerans TaxID=1678131 RepID=UPI0006B4737D|nr:hypothetical protein [Cypionkella psychrotolerans]
MSAPKRFDDFAAPQDGPLTKAEKGWVELLRAICYDGVPTPSLPVVQVLREALDAQRRSPRR